MISSKQIKKYWFWIILGTLLIQLLFWVLIYYRAGNNFMALRLCGSIAYNEKIRYCMNSDWRKADVILLGSSMTLNNIDSVYLEKRLGVSKLVNLGSYGLKMREVHMITESILKVCNPRSFIISSNTMDFYKNSNPLLNDERQIAPLIRGHYTFSDYLRSWDANYYWSQSKDYNSKKKSNLTYDSYHFDQCGGVLLNVPKQNRLAFRENSHLQPELIDSLQYHELRQLAQGLHTKNILFLFVQTPQKPTNRIDDGLLRPHWDKCKEIVESTGGIYINLDKVSIPANEFCDYSHLNYRGARILTSAVADSLELKGYRSK